MESHKVNFPAIVRRIKVSGGFDFYDWSFTEPLVVIEGLTKIPLYPGDRLFIGQAASVARKMKIAQSVIDAHEKSIRDSLRFYAPPDVMNTFEKIFVTTDFLRNASFRNLLEGCFFPSHFYDGDIYLPDELTGNWEAPERNHLPHRILYTEQDVFIAKKVCISIPEIAIALLAFQSSFIEYMQHLRQAIADDPEFLTEEERARGIKVIDEEAFQWQADPLMKKFLPSIAGHYYQNHKGDFSEPVTEQDFNEGMGWPIRKGAFAHMVGSNRINCPGSKTILQTASIDIFSDTVLSENEKPRGFGVLLHSLYQACKRQFSQDEAMKEEVLSVLEKRIYLFTSKESLVVYEKHLSEGEKLLRGKSLPIKPNIYICTNDNPLDCMLAASIYVNISPLWHNRLIDVDKTPVRDEEDCTIRMKKANIILLMISQHFINSEWCYQALEKARSLYKANERIVVAVICSSISGQDVKKILHEIPTIFLNSAPFYKIEPSSTPEQSRHDIMSNVRVLALAGLIRSIVKKHSAYQHFSDSIK